MYRWLERKDSAWPPHSRAEKLDDEEAAMVSAALAHSLAQLQVKRRQRK